MLVVIPEFSSKCVPSWSYPPHVTVLIPPQPFSGDSNCVKGRPSEHSNVWSALTLSSSTKKTPSFSRVFWVSQGYTAHSVQSSEYNQDILGFYSSPALHTFILEITSNSTEGSKRHGPTVFPFSKLVHSTVVLCVLEKPQGQSHLLSLGEKVRHLLLTPPLLPWLQFTRHPLDSFSGVFCVAIGITSYQ